MKRFLYFAIISSLFLSLPSCKILYPNIMFQQKDYQFFELAKKQVDQYIIQKGDQFSIRVYSRDGFRLIDIMGSGGLSGGSGSFLVDNEGFARLPIIGEFYVLYKTDMKKIYSYKN